MGDPEVKCLPSNSNPQNLQLNTNKAGMEGIDAAKINEIIQNASKGSKFYKHKQKCQERIDARISHLKAASDKLTDDQVFKAELEMNVLAQELEREWDLSKTIVYIDMDMFYAAVEMRDNPTLRDKPMAVGSNSMLSTSNYAARKYGVRAAMPGFIARKLCPELIIVPTNFDSYRKVSGKVQEIFSFYDPNFSAMSLDEAYLDITEFLEANKNSYKFVEGLTTSKSLAEIVVDEIRGKIETETQLTASAGIAVNTLLAKVCSDMNKPNGQFYLTPQKKEIGKFINKLPIRKVPGIGNVTEQLLKSLGVLTCSDLWEKRGLLRLLFSETSYEHFLSISLGLGNTSVSSSVERDRKSISTETTFQATSDRKVLFELCSSLCEELSEDMSKKKLTGKVFTLKIKTSHFEVRTRAQTLLEPTNNASMLNSVGQKLLTHEMETSDPPLQLRLLGVRMSNFVSKCDSKKQLTISHLFTKLPTTQSSTRLSDDGKVDPTVIETGNITSASTSKTIEIDCSEDDSSCDHKGINNKENRENEYLSSVDSCTTSVDTNSFICPICSTRKFTDLVLLNSHMDECLNSGLVKELLQESKEIQVFPGSSNSTSAVKRKGNTKSSNSKRRKGSSVSSNVLTKYLGLK